MSEHKYAGRMFPVSKLRGDAMSSSRSGASAQPLADKLWTDQRIIEALDDGGIDHDNWLITKLTMEVIRDEYEDALAAAAAEHAAALARIESLEQDNNEIKRWYLHYYNRMSELESQLAERTPQVQPQPVEVHPPQHLREHVAMELGCDIDELRFVLYNDTAKGEWLERTPQPNNVPLYTNEQIDDIVDNYIFLNNGTSTYRVWEDRANKYLRELRDKYEQEIAFWQKYGVTKNLRVLELEAERTPQPQQGGRWKPVSNGAYFNDDEMSSDTLRLCRWQEGEASDGE